MIYKKDSFY